MARQSKTNTASMAMVMLANTIGMTVLTDTLKDAAYVFFHTGTISHEKQEDSRDSLAFIQGTGLDMMIIAYRINLDAENLRKSFFTMINQRDLIQ